MRRRKCSTVSILNRIRIQMVKLFIAIHWMVLQATVATVLLYSLLKCRFRGEIHCKEPSCKARKVNFLSILSFLSLLAYFLFPQFLTFLPLLFQIQLKVNNVIFLNFKVVLFFLSLTPFFPAWYLSHSLNAFEKSMRIFGHGCRVVTRFPSDFLNVSSLRTTLLIILLCKVNCDENLWGVTQIISLSRL